MTIIVQQAVLHQFIKTLSSENTEETSLLTPHLRESLLNVTPEVSNMMLSLHQAYQGKSKGYGIFHPTSPFAVWLNQWLEQERDFLSLSCDSATRLAIELGKYPFAQAGTFILCQYNFLATDYLFIALLDTHTSMLVNEELNIQPTQYLEMSRFDIACRINLTELRTNPQSNRYLTFIKGRVGRRISDFFMAFLGAEEGLNPKEQNQCLLQAVSDYCKQGELSHTQTREVKAHVFDYCKNQIKNGEEITVDELSEQIPSINDRTFSHFTEESNYQLAEKFPPVRQSLQHLAKFSGSGKGLTISFDANLLHQRIQWDEENDRLIIEGLPPNLRDQLEKAK